MDVEDVEVVVGASAGRSLAEHPVSRCSLKLLVKAFQQMVVELPYFDPFE